MKARQGFTFVEVMVAIVLIGTVVLSLSGATSGMIHSSTESGRNTVLMSLVQERLGQVAADPDYDRLSTAYQGVETGQLQGIRYRRTTLVQHVRDEQEDRRVIDYKRVTVTAEETSGGREITRSITVGAP